MTSPAVQQTLPVVEPVEWQRRPEDDVVHAFRTTGRPSEWLRSRCRQIPLTIALVAENEASVRCSECELLVDGAPGEIVEVFGK